MFPLIDSDAREENTYDSIWAEEVDAASFAATAAAADFRVSSKPTQDSSFAGPDSSLSTPVAGLSGVTLEDVSL